MLFRLFITLLLLNFAAFATQARAEKPFDEYGWQSDSVFAVNSSQFIGESVITGVEISRSDCLRRAIVDLLSTLGIMAGSNKDLGIVIAKTRRTARFGQMNFQSDYVVTVSDRAIKLEFGWKF